MSTAPNAPGSSTVTEFRPPRAPLLGFRIRWDTNMQEFHADVSQWLEDPSAVPIHLAPLFQWVFLDHRNRRTDLGRLFKDIYYSKLNLPPDDEWHFVHPLGRGGFGAVALFERRDRDDDELKDQIVVKTTRARADMAVDVDRIDLSKEAAMMGQTNDLQKEGMVVLRQYKYYAEKDQWKYFFEYCPYGDLERLRLRYKGYGRYLPELFLWHTFYWLARTLREYTKRNEWRDIDLEEWGDIMPGGYLVHSDIKLQNILLGPPDPTMAEPDVSLYPIPRIADLGLAEVTSRNLRRNQARFLQKGTPNWMPPEVRYSKMAPETDYYPFANVLLDRNANARKGRHQVTSRANIWAVGAVMFCLTTMQEINDFSDTLNDILGGIIDPPDDDQTFITDEDFNIIDPQYYSMELRDLIKDCMHIRPGARPSEEDLFTQVSDAYHRHLNTLRNQGYGMDPTTHQPNPASLAAAVDTLPDYKVYFRANDIDSAPDNYRFTHPGIDRHWWNHYFIADFPWLFPSWGKLWPDTMPTDIPAPSDWPRGFHEAYWVVAGNVQQYRNQNPAAAAAAAAAAGASANTLNFAAAIPDPFASGDSQADTMVDAPSLSAAGLAAGPAGGAGGAGVAAGPAGNVGNTPRPAGNVGSPMDIGNDGVVADSAGPLPPMDPTGVRRQRRDPNRFAPYFVPRRGGR